jgi:hypothetical protein
LLFIVPGIRENASHRAAKCIQWPACTLDLPALLSFLVLIFTCKCTVAEVFITPRPTRVFMKRRGVYRKRKINLKIV